MICQNSEKATTFIVQRVFVILVLRRRKFEWVQTQIQRRDAKCTIHFFANILGPNAFFYRILEILNFEAIFNRICRSFLC